MTAPTTVTAGGNPLRPPRHGGDAYWELVERHANAAPPLTPEQRIAIRIALWGCRTDRAEAA